MKLLSKLRSLFRREKLDTDMTEEMRLHIELQTELNLKAGMDPGEGRYAALRQFGNMACIQEQARDARGWDWWESIAKDFRFGARSLRKNPSFTAVVVLTLALGIGINTAVFSVANAVVLQPLPYDQPDQLVQLWEDPGGKGLDRNSVSGGVFADWREQSRAFQQLSALWGIEANLTGSGQPERLSGAQVSADFFDLLRVRPVLGRTFRPEEGLPGHEQVVILSNALWQHRFEGQSNILNQTIKLDGQVFTVIGVLPPGFWPPGRTAQYWIPFGWGSAWWHRSRENNRLEVFARLNPDATVDRARSEMQTITARLKPVYPNYKKGWGVTILPLHEALVGDVRLPLLTLMGAVGFVMLIACLNVANLVLVRAAARQRELGVRLALGAGRWRLTRQLLVEGLVLAGLGGCLGVLLAYWGVDIMVALSPQDLPRSHEIRLDGTVLAFALILSLVNAILCGLAPTWRALNVNLNEVLKEGGRGSFAGAPQRMSRALVVLEVALALMLLVGAGLFLSSFQRLNSINSGMNPHGVLTMQLKLPGAKFSTGESKGLFFRGVIERIESLPGVTSAGVSTGLPLTGGHDNGVVLKGRPESEYFSADYDFATPRYFSTLGIPLLKGRLFAATDTEQAPQVAIVNEAFVKKCLPNEDPIGKRIIENGQREMEIVGVVGDVRGRSLAVPSTPQYYRPMTATDWSDFNLFVRISSDPLTLAGPVRKAILAVDPDQPVANLRLLTGVAAESISGERFLMILSSAFALVALLLAAMGVYGVMAYTVTRRTREIGVRVALGAQHSDVLALVLRQAMATVMLGLAFGLGGTIILTRLLRSLLFEISPTDPATIAEVVLILTVTALLACWLPARRAAKVDPVLAVRAE